MARARGDTGLDAFLVANKPAGLTSHDVVGRVRRLLGTRRVGHGGTLDPLAQGVLPLALGRATRLIDRLAAADKEYFAEVALGLRTTTDDLEGEILETAPVPDFAADMIQVALAGFQGEIEQRPPAFSAMKVRGKRSYDLARAGREVTPRPRRVTIYDILDVRWANPIVSFRVRCSKGTYIRALARDLGERLAVGGTLNKLVRLRVGQFDLAQAATLEQLEAGARPFLLPADTPLLDLPAVTLSADELDSFVHGRTWPTADVHEAEARAYTEDGRFAGLLGRRGDGWQPRVVFLDHA